MYIQRARKYFSLYRYSILANLLLVMMCTGGTCCTRWLLMPWLIIYFINFFCFVSISIILFIYPLPLVSEHAPEFPALRTIGLVPLTIAFILGYFWFVILSLFHKMSSENAEKLKHGGSGSLGGPLLGGNIRYEMEFQVRNEKQYIVFDSGFLF